MDKQKIHTRNLLPLIAASSVIRKKKLFKELLQTAKVRRVSARKIYEILLQSYLFAGFPSALISLKIFIEIFPFYKSKSRTPSFSEMNKRGEKTCRKIYGDKYEKLINNIYSFSPELSDWLVIEGYGKVLSRNQLSLKEREMAIIAMLAVLKFKEQFYSHLNGDVRLGIKKSDISKLIDPLQILENKSFFAFGRNILKSFLDNKT